MIVRIGIALLLAWQVAGGTARAEERTASEVVRKGETLATLSFRVYGTHRLWPEIHAANRDQITDPNHVIEGARLRIPRSPEIEAKIQLIVSQYKRRATPSRQPAQARSDSSPQKSVAPLDSWKSFPVALPARADFEPATREPVAVEARAPARVAEKATQRTLSPFLEMEFPWSR